MEALTLYKESEEFAVSDDSNALQHSPWPLSHEAVGIVIEIGDAVQTIKIGDRVIVPDEPDDGHLYIEASAMPEFAIFGTGKELGGNLRAEFVRVRFADQSSIPIPAEPSRELDYLFISNIWATAWTYYTLSGFQAGDTVVVFGAGPVGLLCAYSAMLRSAAKVYSVDHVVSRIDKAESIGAIPIDFTHNNAATQILNLEPHGVMRCCDCVGYECVNEKLQPQQDAVLRNAVHFTSAGGGIRVIGVYFAQTSAPGRPKAGTTSPTITFPMTEFWSKGLSMTAGVVNPKTVAPLLVELVKSGRGKPSFIVSSEIDIEEVPEACHRSDKHRETKVVIRFSLEDADAKEDGEKVVVNGDVGEGLRDGGTILDKTSFRRDKRIQRSQGLVSMVLQVEVISTIMC